MYVCVCTAVTERQIHDAVAGGAQSLRALRNTLGIVDTCGRCAQCALECLTQGLGEHQCAARGTADATCTGPTPASTGVSA